MPSYKDIHSLAGSHDLNLSAWGPYTKRYAGISHIPNKKTGLRFDLSAFPGIYRHKPAVPNVTWVSNYHPWEASPDLTYFSNRHELIWKDQLYTDIAYSALNDDCALIRCHTLNHSDVAQNTVLHLVASLHFPAKASHDFNPLQSMEVSLPDQSLWLDGLDYAQLTFAQKTPQTNLSWDGQRRGEERAHGFVGGVALASGFGNTPGDEVSYHYTLDRTLDHAELLIRYRLPEGTSLTFKSEGSVSETITLRGNGQLTEHIQSIGAQAKGDHYITWISQGGAPLELDGFAISPTGQSASIHFTPINTNRRPQRLSAPNDHSLILKYEATDCYYGIAWPESDHVVREFEADELDTLMPFTEHNHVRHTFKGKGNGHFTEIFIRPIFLNPQQEAIHYAFVCQGNLASVEQQLKHFDARSDTCHQDYEKARSKAVAFPDHPQGASYQFSQKRMAATVLTNIVYPVRTRSRWIRHHTPGRWWDCLYTWDSGFIGLGLLELSTDRAVENLNAYLTEEHEEDAAFIHHGSPVPVQHYLFLELWNRTRDTELLSYFYPRLQRYHRFLAGRNDGSTTAKLKSNLLNPFDYFYNSGGWDDYPPQKYTHQNQLASLTTPVVTTAHAIRTAKILRNAARALGKPTEEYDADIDIFTRALQDHAWDENAGYYSYVLHDNKGAPIGSLRHEDGSNFNQGLDGLTPLLAGISSAEQEQKMLNNLLTPGRIWSQAGLSTVDQSASYYSDAGYWNGAIWMPYQWFFWKSLLDMGRADDAFRIAETALGLWQKEVDTSYHCFEHFLIQTQRGAGWHQFGGLSSPVLCWYHAYFQIGRLTLGWDCWLSSLTFDEPFTHMEAVLETTTGRAHVAPACIVTLSPDHHYQATWDKETLAVNERFPGVLEITLPTGATQGILKVTKR